MNRFAPASLALRRIIWRPFRRGLNARLGFAIRSGDAASASRLLDLGADPNAALPEGFTPLTLNHTRSDSECAALARLLASRGANPNLGHSSGMRPLHYAALFALPELCRALMDAGADPQALDGGGLTPSERAERYGRPDLAARDASSRVRAELERGALALASADAPAPPRRASRL